MPLEVCRLSSVPGEREARSGSGSWQQKLRASRLAATWWRAAHGGRVERSRAKDDVNGRRRGAVTWYSVTWYSDGTGRRRGGGVVGVRKAKVVEARDTGPRDAVPRDQHTKVVETGDMMHWRVTQPAQLTDGAVMPLYRVHLSTQQLLPATTIHCSGIAVVVVLLLLLATVAAANTFYFSC